MKSEIAEAILWGIVVGLMLCIFMLVLAAYAWLVVLLTAAVGIWALIPTIGIPVICTLVLLRVAQW
jgi:hypothetical protein